MDARPRVNKPIRYVTSSDFNSGGQTGQRENVTYTRNQQGRLTRLTDSQTDLARKRVLLPSSPNTKLPCAFLYIQLREQC